MPNLGDKSSNAMLETWMKKTEESPDADSDADPCWFDDNAWPGQTS